MRLVNHWGYGDAYLGAIIDGMQVKARVPIDGAHDGISMENGYPSRVEPTGQQDDGPRHPVDVAIVADLPNIEHEVTIFKNGRTRATIVLTYGICWTRERSSCRRRRRCRSAASKCTAIP